MTQENTNPNPISAETPAMKQRLMSWIMNNKLSLLLILLIAVVYLWSQYRYRSLEKTYQSQKTELIHTFETRIDSVHLAGIEQSAKLFSWAIRSELLRDNKEQVNLLFLQYIKEKNIQKIQLVDESNHVQLSTDKKDEGNMFTDTQLINNEFKVLRDSLKIIVAVPVMGYNSKMGTLIIQSSKK